MPNATESRPSWDRTRMEMANVIARRSLCTRDQVGAVIVDRRNKIIGEGYNGPPAGYQREPLEWIFNPDLTCRSWCTRGSDGEPARKDYTDCPALHAEANALMMSDRTLRVGGTIYVTSGICYGCAKLVANSGLVMAIVPKIDDHAYRDVERSYTFLESCGVNVIEFE